MKLSALLLMVMAMVSLQISRQPQTLAGAAETGEAAKIRVAESAMMKAGEEKGSAGYMSYYADDAVELPNGEPAIQGKENIAKTMGFLDDKSNRLTWSPTQVDVAASGDLAYTYGEYEFRSAGKDGKTSVEHGKYATVWKKQRDGRWKVVLDMGNANSQRP